MYWSLYNILSLFVGLFVLAKNSQFYQFLRRIHGKKILTNKRKDMSPKRFFIPTVKYFLKHSCHKNISFMPRGIHGKCDIRDSPRGLQSSRKKRNIQKWTQTRQYIGFMWVVQMLHEISGQEHPFCLGTKGQVAFRLSINTVDFYRQCWEWGRGDRCHSHLKNKITKAGWLERNNFKNWKDIGRN